ncbi:MAG: AraC family transcriptional regulator [Vallitalea sp.]|jgi:AraC-like DNA-binding protein|nr:AraC family transcriptional regulator [Vallitalea sp.]
MKKHKIFTFCKLILPYCIILVIIAGLGAKMYYKLYDLSTKKTIENQMSMLNNSKEVIDLRLQEVEGIGMEFFINPEYRNFILNADKMADENYYKYLEVWNKLKFKSFNNTFIFDYALYIPSINLILTPKQMSNKVDTLYYDAFLKYDNMDFKKWKENMSRNYKKGVYLPAHNVNIDNKDYSLVTFIQSLPIDSISNKAVLIVLINETEIQRMFNDYSAEKNGSVFIMNEKGEFVTFLGQELHKIKLREYEFNKSQGHEIMPYDKSNNLLVYTKSEENGWIYGSILPEEVSMREVFVVKENIIKMVVIILFIVVLLCLIFAYYNFRPINELYNRTKGFGCENGRLTDGYKILQNRIDNLIESHDRLAITVKEQVDNIASSIIFNLVTGEYSNVKDIMNMFDELGINIDSNYYCVGIIKVNQVKDVSYTRIIVKGIIDKVCSSNTLTTYFGIDRVVVLFYSNKLEKDEFISYIDDSGEKLIDSLEKNGLNSYMAVGSIHCSLEEIYHSSKEANKVLANVIYKNDDKIYWYDKIFTDKNDYYFPLEAENKLINVVRNGKVEEVKSVLDELFEANVKTNKSLISKKFFVMEICATLYKLYDELLIGKIETKEKYKELFSKMSNNNNYEELIEYIYKEFYEFSKDIQMKKEENGSQLINNINDYIKENYNNNMLGLTDIADKFHISEAYISRMYKDLTGQNFSVYLEKIRMNKAKELLINSNMKIELVAREVGYNSINTFHKAFKRVNGITPGAYKKSKNK